MKQNAIKPHIYLDYNATAPLRPEARAAILDALETAGNPSSIHRFGRLARKTIEDARGQIKSLVNTSRMQDVLFTSSATEAITTVALSFLHQGGHVILGATEHAAMLAFATSHPNATHIAPVDSGGIVDIAAIAQTIQSIRSQTPEAPILISVMLVNNETGVIAPVAELAESIKGFEGVYLHTDAVQAAGRIPLDITTLGVQYLTLSSHKLGGGHGAGALVLYKTAPFHPLIQGGGQEQRRRAGTENVAAIAGFGAAAEAATKGLLDFQKLQSLQSQLEKSLKSAGAIIHGEHSARTPNTTCFSLEGLSSETQLMGLDLTGIAVSSGSACSSGRVEPSHVLRAMGVSDDVARCTVRVSTGWNTEASDIDRFLTAWQGLPPKQ